MDVYDKQTRSAVMRAVKSRNTSPEVALRKALHGAGYRYRLHRKDLPGKPDIVFPSRKKVLFVHGCFWHQHPGCRHADRPSSNLAYWDGKLDANKSRDARHIAELESLGWCVLVVWECQIRELVTVMQRVTEFLKPD